MNPSQAAAIIWTAPCASESKSQTLSQGAQPPRHDRRRYVPVLTWMTFCVGFAAAFLIGAAIAAFTVVIVREAKASFTQSQALGSTQNRVSAVKS